MMKLSDLPEALELQFIKLVKSITGKEKETITNSQTYVINDLSIRVIVNMENNSVNLSNFFSNQLNKAEVIIEPEHSSVFVAVRDFFNKKTKVNDNRSSNSGNKYRFAEFSINGKVIRDQFE